jgi:hypothetical protein
VSDTTFQSRRKVALTVFIPIAFCVPWAFWFMLRRRMAIDQL